MTVSRMALAVAALAALCGHAAADDGARGPGYDPAREAVVARAPAFFFKVALGSHTVAEARSDMAAAVVRLDQGGKGRLDAADARTSDLVRLTELRVAKVVAVLAYDRGNKGRVTRADVEASILGKAPPGSSGKDAEGRVDAVMALDADHDGVIDFDEMRTLTRYDTLSWVEGPVQQLTGAYGPAPVADAAVARTFDAFLSALDLDGDGILSPSERLLAAPYAEAARRRAAGKPPADR